MKCVVRRLIVQMALMRREFIQVGDPCLNSLQEMFLDVPVARPVPILIRIV